MSRLFIKPKPNERQIRELIIEVLTRRRYFVWTNNVGSMEKEHTDKYGYTRRHHVQFGKAGMSDIIGIQPDTGRFVAIEVKTPEAKNRATPLQKAFIDEVNRYGGIGFVAWSPEVVCDKLGIKML